MRPPGAREIRNQPRTNLMKETNKLKKYNNKTRPILIYRETRINKQPHSRLYFPNLR
jgi:hypothetical protein